MKEEEEEEEEEEQEEENNNKVMMMIMMMMTMMVMIGENIKQVSRKRRLKRARIIKIKRRRSRGRIEEK